MEKILIVGVNGMLGNSLARVASDFEVVGTYNNFGAGVKLDITNHHAVTFVMKKVMPDLVVNCAAITNVDFCEENPSVAQAVHVSGTRNLAVSCRDMGAKLVHISTDFVFGGKKSNYTEVDHADPINVYGKTKLEGEKEANGLVIRTCIFGKNVMPKKSMVEWVVEELTSGREISVFSDSFFTPMYTGHLAQVIIEAYRKDLSGLFHVASTKRVDKFTFAKAVAEIYGLDSSLIQPSSIRNFNRSAKRPVDTSLSCGKIMRHGIKLNNFKDEIGMMNNDRR